MFYLSHSPKETRAFAASLLPTLGKSALLCLHGDLGAGKTCFVQGLAAALDVDRPVNSPTYTLVHEYPGKIKLVHIDLYRISGDAEAFGLGLEDYLQGEGIVAVEWPERAWNILKDGVQVRLEQGATDEERRITVEGLRP